MSAVMEHFPKHPVLTIFQNAFAIISVFSVVFCLYSIACLYWLKPTDMDVEFTRMMAIVLGSAFVVVCPLAIVLTRKGRKIVAEERRQQREKRNTMKKEIER